MGLSLDDFDRLLPEELNWILEGWRKEQRLQESRSLAAIRLHAAISVQPHCKKSIAPQDLFAIPEIDDMHHDALPKMSKQERKKRFEELKKARGYS